MNNVPLVSGTSHVKWHIGGSDASEHSGKTPKCGIKEHRVVYDYSKTVDLRLVIGKDSVLQEAHIHFEVLQAYQTSGHTERITLGVVKLNLAEYVNASESDHAENNTISRRYLMQESKINSTLKIEISMKHVEGDRNYTAPALRTAPVFGGIAGIIASDVVEPQEEGANIPTLSTKTQEAGELQDMYRRTLAASWSAGPGEPRADECVEDIFSGGDGWGNRPKYDNHLSSAANVPLQNKASMGIHDDSDDDIKTRSSSTINISSVFSSGTRKPKWGSPKNTASRHGSPGPGHGQSSRGPTPKHSSGTLKDSIAGRTSLEQSMRKMERTKGQRGQGSRRMREIDEFNNPYKEDLRSWEISSGGS